jgi:hypothetical protein
MARINGRRKRTLLNRFYLVSFRIWNLDGKFLLKLALMEFCEYKHGHAPPLQP